MSHVPAHFARGLLKSVTSHLTGNAARGPDHGTDRRVPHRDSYDVADPRARPWSRIGDGSVGAGIAHSEALMLAAEEQYRQGWKDNPGAAVRAARARRNALEEELALYAAASPADVPVGRPAAARMELSKLKADIERADRRLRRTDLTVLKALLHHLDFSTGRLFPTLETIAQVAGCHVNAVKNGLVRLKAHGLVAWKRRTIRTDNEGERGPQREQTSNAYYFEHREKMPRRLWQRYSQILTQKLRRLGNVPAGLQGAPQGAHEAIPAVAGVSGLREAIASFGFSISNART